MDISGLDDSNLADSVTGMEDRLIFFKELTAHTGSAVQLIEITF